LKVASLIALKVRAPESRKGFIKKLEKKIGKKQNLENHGVSTLLSVGLVVAGIAAYIFMN